MEYEIIKRLGILEGNPEGFRIEANIIAWNERAPKLDIRKWQPNNKPSSGVCIGTEGLKELQEILKDVTL